MDFGLCQRESMINYVKGYEENVMNHWPSKYMRLEKAQ